jgi:hypothetical protein
VNEAAICNFAQLKPAEFKKKDNTDMERLSPLQLLEVQRAFFSFNIFAVDSDPRKAARMLCDVHVHKMTLETAQMLSMAHRLLDGAPTKVQTKTGRTKTEYVLSDAREQVLYKTTHSGHPCVVWTCTASDNYKWLAEHGLALSEEYLARYGKRHKSGAMIEDHLLPLPHNMKIASLTPFHQGMPEIYHGEDPIEAYRRFYRGAKSAFAEWNKGVPPPDWYAGSV